MDITYLRQDSSKARVVIESQTDWFGRETAKPYDIQEALQNAYDRGLNDANMKLLFKHGGLDFQQVLHWSEVYRHNVYSKGWDDGIESRQRNEMTSKELRKEEVTEFAKKAALTAIGVATAIIVPRMLKSE